MSSARDAIVGESENPLRGFTYVANPARVLFRPGAVELLAEEAKLLGCERLILLSTPEQEAQARAVGAQLGGGLVGVFSKAAMHTPVSVTEEAMEVVAVLRADGVVSFGGGSTIGLGKAIALRTDLPQIAVPTTYAGSEMTPILGETQDGLKTTQTSSRILPEVVIYDVDLTLDLPVFVSGVSGLNAIAHAVEALYARNRNPIISKLAVEGIDALRRALPGIAANPRDRAARSDALYGAWLCGLCLGSVGMSLHHKLCHTLGGTFNLPHAQTHAVVLPHALAYNAPAVPEVMAELERVLGPDPAGALHDLAAAIGAPRSLDAIGMPRAGLTAAAAAAVSNAYWNPRPLEEAAIQGLLERAWRGDRPLMEKM